MILNHGVVVVEHIHQSDITTINVPNATFQLQFKYLKESNLRDLHKYYFPIDEQGQYPPPDVLCEIFEEENQEIEVIKQNNFLPNIIAAVFH